MKYKKIVCGLISLISCLVITKNTITNFKNNDTFEEPTPSLEYRKKVDNDKYKIIENNNKTRTIAYSSKLIDYYDGYDLTDEQSNYLLNKTITYNATCYYEIGLFTFDNVISDDYGEESDFKFTFYGFTKKVNGHNDVLLHFGTALMLASDVIETDEEDPLCFVPIHLPGGIEIIDRIYIELATISIELVDSDDAEAIALDLMEPITFDTLDNYLHYFFFLFKMQVMINNYNHNVEFEGQYGPQTSYIDNQNAKIPGTDIYYYSNYCFGILANIQRNGCGVIATFNALKHAGTIVSFPALIYYFEYCGADLLFGHFGVNPVPQAILTEVNESLIVAYAVLRPFLILALNIIEPFVYALASISPTELIIPGSGLILAFEILSTIEVLISVAADLVTSLLTWYLSYMRSENEILCHLFGSDNISYYPIGNISTFRISLTTHLQAIICYWIEYSHEDGGVVLSSGAHYIYIYGNRSDSLDFTSEFTARNNLNFNNGPYSPSLINSFFSSSSYNGIDCQFIWGFIIHG